MDTKFVSNYNTILLKCEMNYVSINMISKASFKEISI